jgi:hypothetical protein
LTAFLGRALVIANGWPASSGSPRAALWTCNDSACLVKGIDGQSVEMAEVLIREIDGIGEAGTNR